MSPSKSAEAGTKRRSNVRPFHQRRPTAELHSDLESFGGWFTHLTGRFKAVYGIVLAIPGMAALVGFAMKELGLRIVNLDVTATLAFMIFFQSIAIVILYWRIPDPPIREHVREVEVAQNLPSYDRALGASDRFAQSWRRAWLWWSVLYLVMGCIVVAAIYNKTDINEALRAWSPLLNFIDNVETIFIFLCFHELSFSTHENKGSNIVSGLTVVLLFVLAANFGALHFPPIAWLGKLLGLISGFGAGLALALLVGRLESKLVGSPLYVIVPLYLYAAIQGSFVFLPDDLVLMLLLTSVAFIFKVVLFLFLAWFIDSGVVIFYLHEIRHIYETIPQKRNKFVAGVEISEGATGA
jgi:hypothetical protein